MKTNFQNTNGLSLMTPGISGHVSVLVCSLLLIVGCGGDLPKMAPVSGIVELDGKPISSFDNAAVIFTPQGGRMATGTIDPKDGSFRLSVDGEGDGAIIGTAKVTVSATVDSPGTQDEEKYPGVRWVIPDKFSDRDRSGLTCEVVPGKKNVFRIKINSDGTGEIVVE